MLIKAILVGESEVGKTSLLNRLTGRLGCVKPTIGVDFGFIETDEFKIQIWDFAGRKAYQPIITSFINTVNIIIYVFDLSNRASFDAVTNLSKQFTNTHAHKILLGNKADCVRQIDTEEATEKAISIGAAQYSEVCSFDNSVTDAFDQYMNYARLCEFPYVIGGSFTDPDAIIVQNPLFGHKCKQIDQINTNFVIEKVDPAKIWTDEVDCTKPLQKLTFDVWGFTIQIQYDDIWDLLGCPRRKKALASV